jgi:hypothetical protein
MPIDNRFIHPAAADPVLVLTPDFDSFIITDSISSDTSSCPSPLHGDHLSVTRDFSTGSSIPVKRRVDE